MRSLKPSSGLTHILVVCLILAVSLALQAQQQYVPAPHKPVPPRLPQTQKWHKPAVLRSVVGGLWMIDANYKSSIYLKNDVKVAPITVTPILYLSNGQMFRLAEVKLEPSGTAVVSVNDALAAKGIAPWATLMGYVEVQYSWPWDAICVSLRDVDPVHSLIFTYNLRPAESSSSSAELSAAEQQVSVLEGVWWKQEPNVTGFVSVSNPSAEPIPVQFQVVDDQANVLGSHTVQVYPHGTKVVDLTEMQSTSSGTGGVRVTYRGPEDRLLVYGGLKDPAIGYSAGLPLHFPPLPSAKETFSSYVAVGMMTGEADPMMLFPSGTRFTPYAVVRNISPQTLLVRPKLYCMQSGMSRSAALSEFTVLPYRSMNLNLGSLISAAGLQNFNGSVNVMFEYSGKPKSLLMATGSVDQKNTYVFEVHPQGILDSVAKTLSYWSIADGDDTMINLWNPADEAQDLVFTLFFSSGHYNLPVHLGPKVTQMFNISEIVHNQVADAEGNIIPASAREGSAEIAGPKGENEHILISMDAGIYNVQKATCGQQYCITCQGAVDSWVSPAPYAVGVGGQSQLTFTTQYHSGTQYNLTTAASWSSSNTGVATVSTGMVAGVSPGSANMLADDQNTPDYFHACYGSNTDLACPMVQDVQASGPGGVAPNLSLSPPLWYFGQGVMPPQSFTLGNTQSVITASGASGGSFSWTVTNGANKVSFSSGTQNSNTTTAGNTVTVYSIGFSTTANDVTVQLSWTPQGGSAVTSSLNLSVDSPYKLASTGSTSDQSASNCNVPASPGSHGWQSLVPYKMLSFFGATITNMYINEAFASWTDVYIGNNWAPPGACGDGDCILSTSGTFVDNLCAVSQGTPPSLPPQSPLSTVQIDYASQIWFVGSATSGAGVEVQTNTLTRYQDHGRHSNVVSPVR